MRRLINSINLSNVLSDAPPNKTSTSIDFSSYLPCVSSAESEMDFPSAKRYMQDILIKAFKWPPSAEEIELSNLWSRVEVKDKSTAIFTGRIEEIKVLMQNLMPCLHQCYPRPYSIPGAISVRAGLK